MARKVSSKIPHAELRQRQVQPFRNATRPSSAPAPPTLRKHPTSRCEQVSQEILRLVEASRQGRLDERGKVDQFQGVHREMVQGINEMLDAILLPIGEGNRILAQISNGKIDELIAHTYKGDHEKMKLAVNNVGTVVAGPAEGIDPPDRRFEGWATLRARQDRSSSRAPTPTSCVGVNTMLDAILLPIGEGNRILAQISERQDRRADRPNLQGRSRKDEAGHQQRGRGRAGPAEGIDAPDRGFARRPALRARQAGTVPGRLRRDRARRQRHAGRDSAAHRRRQSHSGPDLQRQDRRADRADLQGRSRKDEAGRQQRGTGAAGPAKGTGPPDRSLQGRQAHRARQSGPVPGRLRRHRARRERHSRRGDYAAERRRQLRRPHQQGRHSAADHRHLSRRFQHHQEQSEHADRRHERRHPRRRGDRPRQSDGCGPRALRPGQADAGA